MQSKNSPNFWNWKPLTKKHFITILNKASQAFGNKKKLIIILNKGVRAYLPTRAYY